MGSLASEHDLVLANVLSLEADVQVDEKKGWEKRLYDKKRHFQP